jgi:predicted CXXCH cytochrome family protein
MVGAFYDTLSQKHREMKEKTVLINRNLRARLIIMVGITAVLLALVWIINPSLAKAANPTNRPQFTTVAAPLQQAEPSDNHPPFSDEACILCHADSDELLEFPSGETLPVLVDPAELAASVHGLPEPDLACQECHQPTNDYLFPHAELTAESLRDYEITRSASCERCHTEPHLTSHPDETSENPVVCTDCHTGHTVQSAESWHQGQNIENCTACHEEQQVNVSAEMATAVTQAGLFAATTPNNSEYCLSCHSQPGLTMTFPSGDELSITIDSAALHDSVHGASNEWQELNCTDCHQSYEFPHEAVSEVSYRQYQLNQNNLCQRCHETEFAKSLNSVHSTALAEGTLEAALCTDCHSAHDMPVPNEPRSRINETCRECHSTIYDEYAESVHGEALIGEENQDVPSCVNCHGVHDIEDPTTSLFRINSPALCADCHADKELMAEYDISTDVFETYVADFHGTTALLFASEGKEGAELNEAVCYDCHGIHNIKSPDDPHAGINENLLETCQQCHPDATENFPASWTGHYVPSLQNNTLVYLIELFYSIVIPVTVGLFGFLVVIDVYGRIRRRNK